MLSCEQSKPRISRLTAKHNAKSLEVGKEHHLKWLKDKDKLMIVMGAMGVLLPVGGNMETSHVLM